MIRVTLIEDHAPTRENLVAVINATAGLRCISAYDSAELALKNVPTDRPDVALVALELPGLNGVEGVAKFRRAVPGVRLLLLTAHEQSDLIFNALRAGASGYLLKTLPADEFVETLKSVCAGGAPMSVQVARKVVEFFHQPSKPRGEFPELTSREQEVLALLATGLRYKAIAEKLNVTLHTVRSHATHIYDKLHVDSRTEATLKYLKKE